VSTVWAVWRDVPHVDAYAPQSTRMHACVLWCGASEEAAHEFARAWSDGSRSTRTERRHEVQVGPMVGSVWAAERAVFEAVSAWAAERGPLADPRERRRVADMARQQLEVVAGWCPACATRQALATVLGTPEQEVFYGH
jgi:hypothetical protein